MKKIVLAIFTVLCVAVSIPQPASAQEESSLDRPIRDKWAVVIGIDKFKDKRIPTLHYSSDDARDFAQFLVTEGNFDKSHVLTLINEEATENNIQKVIGDDWLPRRVLKDDVVVVYASTHGNPRELDVAGENFLIAHDTNLDNLFSTSIELEDLANTIKRRTQCDRLILILDACHSGAAAQSGGKGLTRVANFNLDSFAGQGQIVISSSSTDQQSWESTRYKNGVFTRQLMTALKVNGPTTPLADAFQVLKDNVEQEVRFDRRVDQTPVMKMNWNGKALALLSKPTSPRNSPVYQLSATQNRVDVEREPAPPPVEKSKPEKTKPKQTKTIPRLGIIPFAGPLTINVVSPGPNWKVLWGEVKSKDELVDMASIFTTQLQQQLAQNKRFQLDANAIDMSRFVSAKSGTGFDTRALKTDDWIELGKTTGLQLLLVGEVEEVRWATSRMKNYYSVVSSARIIDTTTGGVVARIDHNKMNKEPMRADKESGGRGYFTGTVTPSAAKAVMEELTGQVK